MPKSNKQLSGRAGGDSESRSVFDFFYNDSRRIGSFLSQFEVGHLQQLTQHNLTGLLLDAAKVRLLTDKIYNYARFVDDSSFGIVGVVATATAWDEIHGKAQGLLFHRQSPDVFFPDLQQRVDCYKEHDVSPWNEKFGD